MTERPSAVLGLLFSVAAAVAALIASALTALGGAGLAALSETMVGVLSVCVSYLVELGRLPPASVTVFALAVASAVALLRAVLAYEQARRLLSRLPLERVERGPIFQIARSAGVEKLYVVPASRPAAFCFGLVETRVVVTEGLLARLEPTEWVALMWHEGRHAQAREPLKLLLAALATRTFFWLPALRDLLDRYVLVEERAADRAAAARTTKSALAGALAEVAGEPAPAGAVGLADFAAARIDRLFDPAAKLPPLFRRSHLILSLVAAGTLVLVSASVESVDGLRSPDLGSMLTTTTSSLCGLPGMAAGFAGTAVVAALAVLVLSRVRR